MALKAEEIDSLCWAKYTELLKEHFGDIGTMAAVVKPQEIESKYNSDLPENIAGEFRSFLESVWKDNAPASAPEFETIMNAKKTLDLAKLKYEEDLKAARAAAEKITAWEKFTSSNHKDVVQYVGLLKDCTEELMSALLEDFMFDVDKYIGGH